ncbi:MAG: NRDE family protein [Streptosporangiaceae bacterium]
MCLLIALFQVVEGAPLLIAANRDELYSRPAVPMTVLGDHDPRVLGGRDEVAGGTWLAVNEHGVVAALTNQPAFEGRDPGKRSRGELPLAFTAYRTAAQAVTAVSSELDPSAYNPCWMLVGDRDALFSVGLAGGGKPEVTRLPPGSHVLENQPLGTPTAKTAQVMRMVAETRATRTAVAAADSLATILSDHRPAGPTGLSAACVHTPAYGTRSAMIVTIPEAGSPALRVAGGPPCQAAFEDATSLWASRGAARR